VAALWDYLVELLMVVLVLKLASVAFRALFGGSTLRVGFQRPPTGPRSATPPAVEGQMVRDPVCGMFVSTELPHQLRLHGETLYFCSQTCLEKYQQETPRAGNE
jgi:YHS domain-containing protein